jgi:AraC-like DNA-binding protein
MKGQLDRMHAAEVGMALPASVARALEWLRAHLDGPVDLDILAAVAGVRPRTLEAHFRQFLGTTPLGWVRSARLARARQDLLSARPQMTVTIAAHASGFSELGRFAVEYRRAFGERPSETLKRARLSITSKVQVIDDEALRLMWGAMPAAFAVASRECNAALEDLQRAQELAPNYGLPKAIAAWCWGQRAAQRFSSTPGKDLARAVQLAEAACTCSPDDPLTLAFAAGAVSLSHRIGEADQLVERALARDPWSPVALMRRGWTSAYLGDSDGALCDFRKTLQLTPFEPFMHLTFIGTGCAHFAAGRYERAALWVRSGVEAFPASFWAERVLVAAAALAGARSEARRIARRLMRKDPDLTISQAIKAWPFRPAFMVRLGEGLAIAGLPRG